MRVLEIWRISASPAVNAADPNAGGGPGPRELARRRQEPRGHPRQLPARDRLLGCVTDPEAGANRDGPGERCAESISLGSRDDLGAHRTTDCFTARECGVWSTGTVVRLRVDHVLQRLSLAREKVRQCDGRRACDGASIQLQPVAAATPDPVGGGQGFDVRATLGRFSPLHGQVLRDAEDGIHARCSLGVEARLANEGSCLLLPGRAGEAFGKRQAIVRRENTKPRWC